MKNKIENKSLKQNAEKYIFFFWLENECLCVLKENKLNECRGQKSNVIEFYEIRKRKQIKK